MHSLLISIVSLDERTGNLLILAGDNIEIEIHQDDTWKLL
ncbi:hypothetical protein [Okeania sp.]